MKRKKVIAVGVAIAMSLSTFTGCGIKTDTPIIGKIVGLSGNEIFKVDELICTEPEYKLVLMDTQNKYKKDFGGSVDWNAKIDDKTTLQNYLMKKTKEDISVKYTLAAMAQEKKVSLSSEEKTEITDAAKKYYNALTEAEKKYTGANQSDVENVYTNYKLADKVYETITMDIGKKISDEEARVAKIQYIHMSTADTKEKTINSTLENVIDLVNGGYQKFSREAKQYSKDAITEKVIKKNEADAIYEKEAFNLSDGQLSRILKDGAEYYLVYCVESYMEKETEKNKQVMIQQEKNKSFESEYNKYLENADTDFNTSAWEKIELSNDSGVNASNLIQ